MMKPSSQVNSEQREESLTNSIKFKTKREKNESFINKKGHEILAWGSVLMSN
jgi:hypothetical protein